MGQIAMEKLIPIVAELVERYTSKESTSVPYDRAKQLMGAVLYFINENKSAVKSSLFSCEDKTGVAGAFGTTESRALEKCPEEQSERELYENGKSLVMARVQEAGWVYEKILQDFNSYGVECSYDTVVKGIPGFFQKYDARYNPQDHILTLDYPVMGSLGSFKGIDVICTYLDRIYLEQSFLKQFSEAGVRKILERFYGDYEELFINPCQTVMRNMVCRLMEEDLKKLTGSLIGDEEKAKLKREIARNVVVLVRELYKEGGNTAKQLKAYLLTDVSDFCAELISAAEHDRLYLFFEGGQRSADVLSF